MLQDIKALLCIVLNKWGILLEKARQWRPNGCQVFDNGSVIIDQAKERANVFSSLRGREVLNISDLGINCVNVIFVNEVT